MRAALPSLITNPPGSAGSASRDAIAAGAAIPASFLHNP
jgi:hypothetical protein